MFCMFCKEPPPFAAISYTILTLWTRFDGNSALRKGSRLCETQNSNVVFPCECV